MAKYRRRIADRVEDRDPNTIWMEFGDGHVIRHDNQYVVIGDHLEISRGPDILFQTHIVNLGKRLERGQVVVGTSPVWLTLCKEISQDPSLLSRFSLAHRKFEEFVAGAYVFERWSDVVLSPPSHDGGFDVSASRYGMCVLDECKAYRSHLVDHTRVRAALGLLIQHRGIDQVRITTTSKFAPLAYSDFCHLIPDKLMLRDSPALLGWLSEMIYGIA